MQVDERPGICYVLAMPDVLESEQEQAVALPPLSLNDLHFINAFESHGFRSPKHIDAYQSVHPGCKRESARVSAERVLQKASVREEIRLRLEAAQVTKESLATALHRYRTWADAKQDYVAGASICMDAAKLAGFLVEKREVHQVNEQAGSAIRDLVSRSMRPASPSLQMVNTDGDALPTPALSATLPSSAATGHAQAVTKCTHDTKSAAAQVAHG